MNVETLGLVVVTVLCLDLWAVTSVIGASRSRTAKAFWIVLVFLLPVLGFLAWLACGPRAVRRDY